MGREVLDADSNSQNVRIIAAISYKKRCRIDFSDGTCINLNKAVALEKQLHKDKKLSILDIDALERLSDKLDAEGLSINLLSRYPHSKRSLKIKLMKKGFNSETISFVIKKLETSGYINDLDYARAWLQSRVEIHPESKRAMYAGLLKRGVSSSTASIAVEEIMTPETELTCLQRIIERKWDKLPENLDIIYKKLLVKGFSRHTINDILNKWEN